MLRSILAVGTPALAAGLMLSLLDGFQEENLVLRNMNALAESIATAKDRKFEIWKTAIERLSDGHVLVRDFDPESLHWMAERLSEDLGGWVVMTAADDVTFQYFNTLTGSDSPVRTNVQVPEVTEAVARSRSTGRPEISDVFLGPVAGTGVVVSAVTATASSGEELLLTLSFKAKLLSDSLAALDLPDGHSVFMIDGSDRFVASSDQITDIFFQSVPVWFGEILNGSPEGVTLGPGLRDVESGEYLYAHRRLPGAPTWHVVVARPRDVVAKAAFLSGLPALGALLVLMITGVLELRRVRAERHKAALRITRAHLETEQALRSDLEATLERVHSLEAAHRKMLGILGHEMRTPVLSALAAIELSAEDANAKDRSIHLPLAARGLQALNSLIDDILDLTRLDAGEFRLESAPVHLPHLLEEAADIIQPMADRYGVPLIREWPEAKFEVLGDRKRLRQILINLLSNAIKYAPGHPITLSGVWSTEAVDVAPVRLCIADAGPGIPEDKLGSLFEPFVRLESAESGNVSGLGLGLPITKRLAEAMGGGIEVDSRPGQGSTFCLSIYLPVVQRTENVASTSFVIDGDLSLEGFGILLVEDHPLQAALVEAVLGSLKAKVRHAPSARDALAIAEDERFDVILIDLGLPDMTGVECVKQLRARGSQAAHIALSANPASLSPEERALFDDAISKTCSKKGIAAAIRNAVSRREPGGVQDKCR